MDIKTFVYGCALSTLVMSEAPAIEYNTLEPIQKMGKGGWMHLDTDFRGQHLQSFLEWKRLLVEEDAIYYIGLDRVEWSYGGKRHSIQYKFRARCAARSGVKLPLGLYLADATTVEPEQFWQLTDSPSQAERSWFNMWWAVCRGVKDRF